MRYIFTGRQMKEIDNYTINTTKIPSLVLMERASYEVAKEIMKRFGKEERIVVVCGNGNNGADGMCTARILSEYGYQASYIYEFDAKKATDELRTQLTICENEGKKRATLSEISTYSIIVDGQIAKEILFATSNHAGEMYRQFGRLTKNLEGTIWHAYLLV